MRKTDVKKSKKPAAQTAMFVTKAETEILWTLMNSPLLAVTPRMGNAANGLYNKVKKAAEDVGVSTALPQAAAPGNVPA